MKSLGHSSCLLKHILAVRAAPLAALVAALFTRLLHWVLRAEAAAPCGIGCNGWLHKSHFSAEVTQSDCHALCVKSFLGTTQLTLFEYYTKQQMALESADIILHSFLACLSYTSRETQMPYGDSSQVLLLLSSSCSVETREMEIDSQTRTNLRILLFFSPRFSCFA